MFFHNYVEELSRGKRALEPGAQSEGKMASAQLPAGVRLMPRSGPNQPAAAACTSLTDANAAGVAAKAAKLGPAQSVGGLVPQPGVAGAMQPQFVPTGPAPLTGGMLLPNGTPLLNGGAPQPGLPLGQPGGGLGMLPGGFAGAVPMAPGLAAPPFGLGGLGSAPLGMPGLDVPLDPTGVGGFGAASVSLSAGLGRGGDEAASAEGGSGGGKGRHKTAKQQEANKIAQQRYRERKKVSGQQGGVGARSWRGAGCGLATCAPACSACQKLPASSPCPSICKACSQHCRNLCHTCNTPQAKFHEMEEQIAMLSKQLQALQALQSRNQILEVRQG